MGRVRGQVIHSIFVQGFNLVLLSFCICGNSYWIYILFLENSYKCCLSDKYCFNFYVFLCNIHLRFSYKVPDILIVSMYVLSQGFVGVGTKHVFLMNNVSTYASVLMCMFKLSLFQCYICSCSESVKQP